MSGKRVWGEGSKLRDEWMSQEDREWDGGGEGLGKDELGQGSP